MLQLFLVFGFGLLVAAIYKAVADKSDRVAKLERVRREIARREAEALQCELPTDMQSGSDDADNS